MSTIPNQIVCRVCQKSQINEENDDSTKDNNLSHNDRSTNDSEDDDCSQSESSNNDTDNDVMSEHDNKGEIIIEEEDSAVK